MPKVEQHRDVIVDIEGEGMQESVHLERNNVDQMVRALADSTQYHAKEYILKRTVMASKKVKPEKGRAKTVKLDGTHEGSYLNLVRDLERWLRREDPGAIQVKTKGKRKSSK